MSRILRIGLAAALLPAVCVVVYGATPLKLPYGPEGKGRFGAYYTTLKYSPEWDAQWRVGSKADVVVRFDQYDYRLVFWRGTNYVPFWVNENRVWSSFGCVERPNASPKWDKLCKYSFASVIESNDARVVIRWRYAPVDKDGKLVNTDPMTNWSDWVDEYYTIYPDAVAVRNIKFYSSNVDAPVYSIQSYSTDFPSLVYKSTAGMPDAERDTDDPATVSGWQGSDVPSDWSELGIINGDHIRSSLPIRQTWKPYAQDKTSKSWMMITWLQRSNVYVNPNKQVGRSWRKPPQLTIIQGVCKSLGYDKGGRAYQLCCTTPGATKLKLAAGIYNPAFVIKGWGKSDISLSIDGKPVPRGPDFRYGFRRTDNASDLIIWVKKQSTKPVTFEIKPVGGGK